MGVILTLPVYILLTRFVDSIHNLRQAIQPVSLMYGGNILTRIDTVFPLIGVGADYCSANFQTWRLLQTSGLLETGLPCFGGYF